MKRLERAKRTCEDLGILSKGGMFYIFDNIIKETFRINDDEYDFICNKATCEELNFFIIERPNFSEKRVVLSILNKYLIEFENIKK